MSWKALMTLSCRALVMLLLFGSTARAEELGSRSGDHIRFFRTDVTSSVVDGVTYRAVVGWSQYALQDRTPTELDAGWTDMFSARLWLQTIRGAKVELRELVLPFRDFGGRRPHGFFAIPWWEDGVLHISAGFTTDPGGNRQDRYASCTLSPDATSQPTCVATPYALILPPYINRSRQEGFIEAGKTLGNEQAAIPPYHGALEPEQARHLPPLSIATKLDSTVREATGGGTEEMNIDVLAGLDKAGWYVIVRGRAFGKRVNTKLRKLGDVDLDRSSTIRNVFHPEYGVNVFDVDLASGQRCRIDVRSMSSACSAR
jgi:hypothetical protein